MMERKSRYTVVYSTTKLTIEIVAHSKWEACDRIANELGITDRENLSATLTKKNK